MDVAMLLLLILATVAMGLLAAACFVGCSWSVGLVLLSTVLFLSPICYSALLLFSPVLLLSIDTVQPSLCCYVPMPDVLLCSYACRVAQPMAAILMCCYDPIPTVLPMPVMLNPCLLNCSTQAFSSCSLLCSYVC
ncbi:hypothetical protein U1Q18_050081 [Sarracenia purpurea var. burkii]